MSENKTAKSENGNADETTLKALLDSNQKVLAALGDLAEALNPKEGTKRDVKIRNAPSVQRRPASLKAQPIPEDYDDVFAFFKFGKDGYEDSYCVPTILLHSPLEIIEDGGENWAVIPVVIQKRKKGKLIAIPENADGTPFEQQFGPNTGLECFFVPKSETRTVRHQTFDLPATLIDDLEEREAEFAERDQT